MTMNQKVFCFIFSSVCYLALIWLVFDQDCILFGETEKGEEAVSSSFIGFNEIDIDNRKRKGV